MKFSIDIDCTPEEARAFFGLPNVEALNAAMMEQIQAQMLEHMRKMDPEEIARSWMPSGAAAWEQFQKIFGGFPGAGGAKPRG